MTNVCVVVLNWNGQAHLPPLLESLQQAKATYERQGLGACRLVVLDNPGPTDDAAWIQQHAPAVECRRAPANDFLYSYNWLLPQLSEPYVVLLNNDLRVDAQFLQPLIQPLSAHQDVFATSARSLSWDGESENGAAFSVTGRRGWYWWQMDSRKETTPTLFAVGGYMAVDRARFIALGGFDLLFYPAYGEDIDLCLRAWERGWRSLYVPESVVYHRQSASWEIGDRRDRLFRLGHLLILERYFSSPAQRAGRTLHLLRQLLRPNTALPVLRCWLHARLRSWSYRGRRCIPLCLPPELCSPC
jgi:N-acetylglucosaminyl-diphospho-decaprenol L-rhamnosyltransferase